MSCWRYLTDAETGAAAGLAVDEAMLLRYGRDQQSRWPASLRLYTYRPHCALVGRYQSLEDEVDLEFCRGQGIEVGRRPTGGGAIIMGPAQLGVAIAARALSEETPRQALARFAEGVIAGLAGLGVEARFRRKNDLEVGGRKIAGLGLYLDRHGATLFHSSVLVDLDVALMLRVLRIPGAKLSDKAVAGVEQRVTTVSRELGRPLEALAIRRQMAAGIAEAFGVELERGDLDDWERQRCELLLDRRYANRQWVHQRSPRRDARGSALLKTPGGLLRLFVGVHGDAIKSLLVTGDFNVLPPALPRLEAALKWCGAEPAAIARATAEALGEDGLGVAHDAVADAIWRATREAVSLAAAGHPERLDGSCYFPDRERPPGPAEAAEDGG